MRRAELGTTAACVFAEAWPDESLRGCVSGRSLCPAVARRRRERVTDFYRVPEVDVARSLVPLNREFRRTHIVRDLKMTPVRAGRLRADPVIERHRHVASLMRSKPNVHETRSMESHHGRDLRSVASVHQKLCACRGATDVEVGHTKRDPPPNVFMQPRNAITPRRSVLLDTQKTEVPQGRGYARTFPRNGTNPTALRRPGPLARRDQAAQRWCRAWRSAAGRGTWVSRANDSAASGWVDFRNAASWTRSTQNSRS